MPKWRPAPYAAYRLNDRRDVRGWEQAWRSGVRMMDPLPSRGRGHATAVANSEEAVLKFTKTSFDPRGTLRARAPTNKQEF